jgi:pimeloyl-ACP methyl ester carboxylesterase
MISMKIVTKLLITKYDRHLEGNSRLVVIKNAGHAVNIEKPKEVCRNIIEFFKEPVAGAANVDDKV